MESLVKQAAPPVKVFPDDVRMSRAAAEIVTQAAVHSIASRNKFMLALSGGSTPRMLYCLLASSPHREAIPWQQVQVFWADERSVPRDHPESNYKLALDTLLAHVPIPANNIHPVAGKEEPDRAAAVYEDDLRKAFSSTVPVFDLVILGVGTDGHTASLFPGSPVLQEKKLLAAAMHPAQPGLPRVTLTLPVLNSAARILFLVTGSGKSGIVREILEEGNPRGLPAGLVRPVRGEVIWMLDREAGSLLTRDAHEQV